MTEQTFTSHASMIFLFFYSHFVCFLSAVSNLSFSIHQVVPFHQATHLPTPYTSRHPRLSSRQVSSLSISPRLTSSSIGCQHDCQIPLHPRLRHRHLIPPESPPLRVSSLLCRCHSCPNDSLRPDTRLRRLEHEQGQEDQKRHLRRRLRMDGHPSDLRSGRHVLSDGLQGRKRHHLQRSLGDVLLSKHSGRGPL